MTNVIDSFEGEYEFLSNFYPSKISVKLKSYPTVEHAFQAAKCLKDEDREAIRLAKSPEEAKRLGQLVTKVPDWQTIKRLVMFRLVQQKFLHNPELRAKLIATGTSPLIEGNTWHDTYWGVCDGVGENRLGEILVAVRDQARMKSLFKAKVN